MPIPSFDPNQYNWDDPANPQPITGGPGGFAAHVSNPVNIAALAPSLAPQTSIKPQPAPDFFNANSNLLQPPAPSPAPSAPDMSWFKPAAQPSTAQPQVAATIPQVAAQGVTPQSATPQVDPGQMFGSVPSQTQADQQRLTDLQKSGAGLNKINNPVLRTLARIGDVGASLVLKNGAQFIPGTTAHNLQLQGQQQGVVDSDVAADQARARATQSALANQDTQSQIAQRNSTADLNSQKSDFYKPVTVSAAQAQAMGMPGMEGEQLSQKALAALMEGQQKGTIATGIQTAKGTTATTVAGVKADAAKAIQDAKGKTAALVQGMKSSTSTANTNARISGQGQGGNYRVPADVTKRAALASNVNENADAAEAVVSRNPNIVGAMGGRYSNVQQMMGSNDPDIAELGVRMHNMALASNGAHGVRSQEAVQKTEDELFNNFKMGPQGIKSALGATRSSVQTFLNDEQNFQTSGKRTGAPGGAPPAGSQALSDGGVTYHIPASMVAAFKKDHPNAR